MLCNDNLLNVLYTKLFFLICAFLINNLLINNNFQINIYINNKIIKILLYIYTFTILLHLLNYFLRNV